MRKLSRTRNSDHAIVTAINELIDGNNNARNEITLGSGQNSNFTSDQIGTEININSFIDLMPMGPIAAALKYSGDLFISQTINGAFTVTHPSSSDGVEFRIIVLGGSGL